MTATARLVFDTLTPVAAYAALRDAAPDGASFLFESVVGGERRGRRTLVGYRPRTTATLTAGGWSVNGREMPRGDPLVVAAGVLGLTPGAARRGPATPEGFAEAHFGYFAWELVHSLYRVPPHAGPPRPLARFVGGCTLVVFDNLEQTLTIVGPTEEDVRRARSDLARAPRLLPLAVPDRAALPEGIELGMSDAEYMDRVARAKEYIAAGDAFQIVLARTFSVPAAGNDPFDAYRALRVLNPSPYMYYWDLPPDADDASGGRTQILGASPETLAHLDDGVMTVRPIAGTRARGATPGEDRELERELVTDPKERAEHVMLIDLGRNDVGRVAGIGTVELVRRMEVERYSHVMHLVSEVRGQIPGDVPALLVLSAAFPAGTLSGAPKLRAMQIIRELEAGPRGIYGGAVGYVLPSGDFDFAIAIRTAVCEGGRFVVTAGAGIVEGSVPEAEAKETWSKARGVLCALQAGRG